MGGNGTRTGSSHVKEKPTQAIELTRTKSNFKPNQPVFVSSRFDSRSYRALESIQIFLRISVSQTIW